MGDCHRLLGDKDPRVIEHQIPNSRNKHKCLGVQRDIRETGKGRLPRWSPSLSSMTQYLILGSKCVL